MFSWEKVPSTNWGRLPKKKLKHNYNYHKTRKKHLCDKNTLYMIIIKIRRDGNYIVHCLKSYWSRVFEFFS